MARDLFDTEPKPLEVSELLQKIKSLLQPMPLVLVAGEVSNLTLAKSGHAYLTLKDASASLKVVIFRAALSKARFEIAPGMRLRILGKVDLYVERGDLQFIGQELTPEGIGALELAFRQRREKMEALGWFAAARKRPLPRFPRVIGIITSASGSAIRDMLETLRARWPLARVVVAACQVQGNGAAEGMARALGLFGNLNLDHPGRPEVILLGRGGGSMEDLWAFNEEILVKAVIACPIPIAAGIGHEDDVTLVDLAADFRALTPTHAAQSASPILSDWIERIDAQIQFLRSRATQRFSELEDRLDQLSRRAAWRRPREWLVEKTQKIGDLAKRLRQACLVNLARKVSQIDALGAQLGSMNPLQVLERGYTLTSVLSEKDNGKAHAPRLLRDISQIEAGSLIETRLHQGLLTSRVVRVNPDPTVETVSPDRKNSKRESPREGAG